MPTTKITDLLPIPEGTRAPHAYQIYGLEDGEQDVATITKAVQATIARLKAAKSSTDADLWTKAARLVQQARQTLTDPETKAQLDARFGIIAIDDNPQPSESNSTESAAVDPLAAVLPASDPLAAVLPAADPLAAVLPAANPLSPAASPLNPLESAPTGTAETPIPIPNVPSPHAVTPVGSMPPGVFGAAETGPAEAISVAATPVVVKPKKVRRRKRSTVSMLIVSAFVLGMLGLICVIGYVLLSEGQLAISSTDGQITISAQKAVDEQTPQVGPARPVTEARPRREFDPVMGKLGGDAPPPGRPPQPSGLVSGIESTSPSSADLDAQPEPLMQSPPDEPATPNVTDTEPMTDPEAMQPLTDEMIADADETLERVRTLLREANWSDMKAAATAATEARMSDEQKAQAEALYELADLASYYRGGIERAVAKQNAGNEIVVNEVRLIVVETGDDLLVVKLNGRNRTYKFDEFSFSLAHELASYEVAASPTFEAAKAVYQAIAPKSTEDHRAQALQWLREINDEVEGADPRRMAETLEALFDA